MIDILADDYQMPDENDVLSEGYGAPSKPQEKSWYDRGLPGIARQAMESGRGFAEDVLNLTPEKVAEFARMLWEEGKGAGQQVVNEPGRAARNAGAGLSRGGHGLINTPANVFDYLAKKEAIPSQLEGHFPRLSEPNYNEAFGIQGEKKGDRFIQNLTEYLPYMMGGEAGAVKGLGRAGMRSGAAGLHATGQNEDPVKAALAMMAGEGAFRGATQAPGAIKRVTGKVGNAVKGIDITPSGITAKHFGGHLPIEEIAKNAKAAEGTKTGLGRVLQSPSLTKFQENILADIPGGGGQQALSEAGQNITQKAKSLVGEPKSSPNEMIQKVVTDARQAQNKLKNTLFEPVNELAKKEKLQLELPKSTKLAKDNIKAIQDSPLYKANDKFRRSANKLFGLTKTSEKVQSPIVDASGKAFEKAPKTSAIVDARVVSSDLYDAGQKMLKSPNAIDQQQGKLYLRLAKSIKDETNSTIQNKGSEALKKADAAAIENFKKNYAPFLDKDVHKLLGSEELSETFIRDVIRPGKQTDKAARIKKVQSLLPEKDRGLLGEAYLAETIDKQGMLDPRKLSAKIDSLGPRQFKALFNEKAQQGLLDFQRLVKMNPEAVNAMFNPKTGARATSWASGILTGILGGSNPLTLAAVAATQAGGARYFQKLLTDPAFRQKVIDKIQKIRPEK